MKGEMFVKVKIIILNYKWVNKRKTYLTGKKVRYTNNRKQYTNRDNKWETAGEKYMEEKTHEKRVISALQIQTNFFTSLQRMYNDIRLYN